MESDGDAQSKSKYAAVRARADLRWANHLDRKKSRGRKNWIANDIFLLQELDSGKLRKRVNEATVLSGHGRSGNSDGRTVDIGGSTGGTARVVMDSYAAPVFPRNVQF